MATYWVSTVGTDTNSGTNYAAAVKTLGAAITAATDLDTINIVNDGTHSGTSSAYRLTSFIGTNFTDSWGIKVQGTDSSGNPAMAEISLTTDLDQYVEFQAHNFQKYTWIQGLKFTCYAVSNVTGFGNSLQAIGILGNSGTFRVNDCEMWFTTQVGSTVDLINNNGSPGIFAPSGASTAPTTCFGEVYNNVLVNADMRIPPFANGRYEYHNNVFIMEHNKAGQRLTMEPTTSAGGVDTSHSWYNNTFYHVALAASVPDYINKPALDTGWSVNSTGTRSVYNNLIYVESTSSTTYVFDNYTIEASANTEMATSTNNGTVGYNGVVMGTNLAAFFQTLPQTSTTTGLQAGFMSPAWRATETNSLVSLNTGDIFQVSTYTRDNVFPNATSTYTWTPGDYSHDLPRDLRTTGVFRTGAIGSQPMGAIQESANQAPLISGPLYTPSATMYWTVIAGQTLTISATDGLATVCSDPDGDTLSYTFTTGASQGVRTLNTTTGAIEFTAPLDTYSETWYFACSDGVTTTTQITDNGPAYMTVFVLNTTPTCGPLNFTTPENISFSVTAGSGLLSNATDADGHTLTVASAATPTYGTLVYNTTTGTFTYTPNFGYVGADSFTYVVSDSITNSSASTVLILMTEVAAPERPEYLDVEPFFKPRLEVRTEMRIKTKKNRRKHHDVANYTEDILPDIQRRWDESTHRIINLATNSTSQVTLGGVAEAEYLMVETDAPISVAINSTDLYWPVSSVVAVALSSGVETLYLRNTASTTTPQVILCVVD
jgi:hypothetical protein